MQPNPQQTANLETFTEEILMENFIFCSVDLLGVTERDQWHEMGQGASNLYPNADDAA